MEKQQDNEYPKHGVWSTDPKIVTKKSNIVNPKIDHPQGNLNFFDKPDPFFSSDYTITLD